MSECAIPHSFRPAVGRYSECARARFQRDGSFIRTHFVYGRFMMIQTSEALELCSESEWELIEHSFSPMVAMLPRSALKSRLGLARKLYAKTTDLVSLQHSEPRKRTTRRKIEMFAEAINRFEATLDLLENAQSVEPAPKDVHNQKRAEETDTQHGAA